MDRQYTLCVLVPAHQYRTYVNNYHQQAHQRLQQHQRQQYSEQQRSCKQPYQQEQIYENVVSQYRMRMCYHNDYENDEQIQRFYWEQCYRREDTDATAYYYCEYVRTFPGLFRALNRIVFKSVQVKFLRCIINKDFVSVSSFALIGSNILYFVLLKIFLSLCNLVYFSFRIIPSCFLGFHFSYRQLSDFSFE